MTTTVTMTMRKTLDVCRAAGENQARWYGWLGGLGDSADGRRLVGVDWLNKRRWGSRWQDLHLDLWELVDAMAIKVARCLRSVGAGGKSRLHFLRKRAGTALIRVRASGAGVCARSLSNLCCGERRRRDVCSHQQGRRPPGRDASCARF